MFTVPMNYNTNPCLYNKVLVPYKPVDQKVRERGLVEKQPQIPAATRLGQKHRFHLFRLLPEGKCG